MNTNLKIKKGLLGLALLGLCCTACQKNSEVGPEPNSQTELAANGAVALVPIKNLSGFGASISTDSIYAMEACFKDQKKDSISLADLPSKIVAYVDSTYTGYSIINAFTISSRASGELVNYLVAVHFNGKPVALQFDVNADFVKVLELRNGKDARGPKGPKGKRFDGFPFEHRDGKQRDSIALNDLDTVIINYMIATYPTDTLRNAWLNKGNSIVIVSQNGGFFSTVFDSEGSFINRKQLFSPMVPPHQVKEVSEVELLTEILTYLEVSYPDYVIKNSFEIKNRGNKTDYLLIIDANLTKYALHFNGNGKLISTKTIR